MDINSQELSGWLLDEKQKHAIQVIDVRDEDFSQGKIKNALNWPSEQLQTMEQMQQRLATLPESVTVLVFHCRLSQVRGPAAARLCLKAMKSQNQKSFQVYVLQGGFKLWWQQFGNDQRLTEPLSL